MKLNHLIRIEECVEGIAAVTDIDTTEIIEALTGVAWDEEGAVVIREFMLDALADDSAKDQKDCECKNWCRDGRDMYSDHHNRCPKYTAPPTDPRFARFGEAVWHFIVKTGSDFFGCESSEDILTLAAKAGLCCRVPYDPELHGDIDAEPGDEIWWWEWCGKQEERLDPTLLSAWEKCAYDHEADFFEEFGPTSAWELVEVSFHAVRVEYTVLLECGVQCTSSVPMEDWLKFYEANAEPTDEGT